MSSESLHEPYDKLSTQTLDLHRGIVSLMEELEAVDWYQQRADNTTDPELKRVIEHNRDEEIEHSVMLMEWLRRNNAVFAEQMSIYLNTSAPITEVEAMHMSGEGSESGSSESVGLAVGKPGKQN